jgi:hypothetical protein
VKALGGKLDCGERVSFPRTDHAAGLALPMGAGLAQRGGITGTTTALTGLTLAPAG